MTQEKARKSAKINQNEKGYCSLSSETLAVSLRKKVIQV